MSEKLSEAFDKFVDSAKALAGPNSESSVLRSAADVVLPRSVEELEKRNEFKNLVAEVRVIFSGEFHQKSNEQNWRYHLHNFFCQSGYYLDIAHRRALDKEAGVSSLSAAFQKRESRVTYFIPLELVSLTEEFIDFGTFKIRRFSSKEWDNLLRNRINRVFYPYAALDADAIELISHYWFVCVEDTSPIEQIGPIRIPASPTTTLLFRGLAERYYTTYPESVESVLRLLCLFDWSGLEKKAKGGLSSKENWQSLRLFNVPFILEVKDDLLSPPASAPDLSELSTESVFDERGEEIGQWPEHWISLDNSETEAFKDIIQDIKRVVGGLKTSEYGWQFIEVALGYFTKAFFTSNRLEQMLWYVTSMESLLGERGAGVTERLARRIGSILGTNNEERDKYSERFRQLYRLRNSLVHGGQSAEASVADLLDTYLMARRAILWFLHALDLVQSKIGQLQKNKEDAPDREELLMFLDLKIGSRDRLQWLKKEFPVGFPDVGYWLK